MFHQVEAIFVDKDVPANLKDLIHQIIFKIFEENVEIRFRPWYPIH